MACILFFALRVVRAPDAFAGYVNPSVWLVLFALVMAKAVERSGLGRRIASWLMSKMPLSFNGLVLAFIVLCLVFPFFIPSAGGSIALIMALAVGTMDALGIERGPHNRMSNGLTCFIAILVLTMSKAPLTGAVPNLIAAGLVRELTGVDISWMGWLKCMWVGMPIPAIATYFYVTRLYKPEKDLSPEAMRRQVESTLAELGPLSPREIRTGILMLIAIVLWILDPWLKFGTNEVGVVIGVLFLMPYIGCLTMADFKALSWETFVFCGGSFSIGVVLARTGFAQWTASGIQSLTFLKGSSFVLVGFAVLLFAFLLHFLLETVGEISLVVPVMVKAGLLAPKATAMLVDYGAGLYVFPFQGVPIILSLGFNTTGWKDVTRYGFFFAILGLLQAVLLLAIYWEFVMR